MLDKLDRLAASPVYWAGLFLFGLSLEAVALVYQYAWDYYPCVLCIHVRIWVLGLVIASFTGLLIRRNRVGRVVAHSLVLVMSIGMLERSWQLFAIERGFAMAGECNFDAGLPAWFALDQWFPSVFKVWESCGYTPQLLFGITMAEALLAVSSLLTLAGVWFAMAALIAGRR